MNRSSTECCRQWWSMPVAALLVGLSLSTSSVPSLAAEPITGLDTQIIIKAREQPVAKFTRELFGQMGVPVVVNDGVRGAVNGDFDKPAHEVMEDLRKAFQLSYYYDGAVLHVYPSSERNRKILYLPDDASARVMSNANSLNLTDGENSLRKESMGLVATGTPRFLEQVREIADAVKARSATTEPPEAFRVFKLRYGWADDVSLVVGGQKIVVPGVATLLRSLVGTGGVASSGVSREVQSATRPSLKGQGLQSIGANTVIPGQIAGELSPQAVLAAPTSGKPGEIKIVADPLNNAIVIRDRIDRMVNYERLIETLDVEPLMVEIEATIIDMNTDRLRQLGLEWRLETGDVTALFGGSTRTGNVTPIGEGGVVSMVLGDRTRFLSRVRALEEQGAARIVSKPHVITLANVEALLDSTSTFFVRVEGQEEVDLFDVSVGTSMRVTPHVFQNRGGSQIKLLVSIEDGSTSDQRVDEIPVIARSSINTQALVKEGQSLLIGGLIREANNNNTSKVPILGDLPGIGGLFRNNAKSSTQRERMFLITPRLASRSTDGELRLDVPILAGTDGEIIRSAPIRLESARAGLNARDEAFPLPKKLPQGSAVPTLQTTEPARAARAPIRLERVPPANPEIEPSLPHRDEQPRALNVSEAAVGPDAGDVWRAVPGSTPDN